MTYKTLVKISKDLAAGDYSSRELTQDVIADIKARDSIYNSFISVSEDLALRQADAADARISAGTADILTGVPFAHKDLFCTQDHTTTAASKMLEHFVPPYESTVGQRLLSAGAYHCSYPPSRITAHAHRLVSLLIPTVSYHCSRPPSRITAHTHRLVSLLTPTVSFHCSRPPSRINTYAFLSLQDAMCAMFAADLKFTRSTVSTGDES